MKGKRFVAVADILGFKALLTRVPLEEIASRIALLLDGVSSLNVRFVQASDRLRPGVFRPKSANFSDSLVLWSDILEDFADNLRFATGRMFAQCLAELLGRAFVSGMPLRIGVAFGETYVDPERNIVIGQPLVEAFALEKAQEWIGGAFPLKDNTSHSCAAALDWCPVGTGDNAALEESLSRLRSAMAAYVSNTTDEGIRRKYLNTQIFCNSTLGRQIFEVP
jgi:hypothetical protein